MARDGGVLVRAGQTEGSVDLCRLAGMQPAAVIIEIMNDDGTMARVPDLTKIAKEDKDSRVRSTAADKLNGTNRSHVNGDRR